ncbi:MAG: DUF2971 domain-containing protein [Methylococcales bacterium]
MKNEDMSEYFYKYRSIKNTDDLNKDNSIKALLNNHAIFSNRKNFNDLFDSKINLINPTPKQLKELKNKLVGVDAQYISSLFSKGKFLPEWKDFSKIMNESFNAVVDGYVFYCVSTNPISNLMWSHYAGAHYGFCIEFKKELLQATEVSYEKNIPSLQMLDLIKLTYKISDNKEFGVKIWAALRTKLEEWGYEDEYRFQADNKMLGEAIKVTDKYTIIEYPDNYIESIIFGYRMDNNIREFVINNMPDFIKYKEVIIKNSGLKVIDYNVAKNI